MRFLATFALTIFLYTDVSYASSHPDIVVRNTNIINVETGNVKVASIAVAGGYITEIAPTITVNYRESVVIDGTDKYVIPGLWDMHVHLTGDRKIQPAMFNLFIAYGITSVRDTGGRLSEVLAQRTLANQPNVIAPRIFIAGHMIDGMAKVFDGSSPILPLMAESASSIDEVKKQISLLASHNVDFIKVYEMIGHDVFAAAVAEAEKYDLPVTAHIPLAISLGQALMTNLKGMEHLRNIELSCASNSDALLEERKGLIIDKQGDTKGNKLRRKIYRVQKEVALENYNAEKCRSLLELMASKQVAQVPTLSTLTFHTEKNYQQPEWRNTFNYLPEGARKQWDYLYKGFSNYKRSDYKEAFSQWAFDMVGEMNKLGLPIMAGTDTPVLLLTPGYSLHGELELLVKSGLTPLEALRAATLTPAKWFNKAGQVGNIVKGAVADMLILSKNPLDDIRHTLEINTVISQGKIYNRDSLNKMLNNSY